MKLASIILPGRGVSGMYHSSPKPPNRRRLVWRILHRYIVNKKGEQLIAVQTPQGVRSDCKLPGGEVIDEWVLWRRDHPTTGK